MISDSTDSTASPTGLLLSGGLDSCILLRHLLDEGHDVRPFYVRTGLFWQREELLAVERFLRATNSSRLQGLVLLDMPLADLYGDHWSVTGRGVPDASTADEAVYLPGRNALLAIKPAIWCRQHGIETLALAILRSNPFSDATPAFFAAFETMLRRAVGATVRMVRPFAEYDKRQVMQRGQHEPLALTFSCIAPTGGLHCGICNKCAERINAFRLIGADDPTKYAAAHNATEPE